MYRFSVGQNSEVTGEHSTQHESIIELRSPASQFYAPKGPTKDTGRPYPSL